mgnify:CR=1 FL=1
MQQDQFEKDEELNSTPAGYRTRVRQTLAADGAGTKRPDAAAERGAGGRDGWSASGVTASIGVALCPQDGQTGDVLTHLADEAMYQAKQQGRNRYCLFAEKPAEIET